MEGKRQEISKAHGKSERENKTGVYVKTCSGRVRRAMSGDPREPERKQLSVSYFLRNIETFGCCIQKTIRTMACGRSKIKGDACLSLLVVD